MKKIKVLLLTFAIAFTFTNCFEDLDDNFIGSIEIKDFVWKGMNAVYLYKSEIPDLANDRFASDDDYNDYLNSFGSPEVLFESLKYLPETVDRFSRITDNYLDLQNFFQGTTLSNGIEFNLYRVPNTQNEVFGAITLVLNNSVADNLGLERGMIFRAVNGTNLNDNNINDLLLQDSYTLNFADYNDNGTPEGQDDSITLNGESESLSRVEYTENPVHIAQIINLTDSNVGYLMYNAFNNNFESDLNAAFGFFQAAGVSDLVVDLRYNGGGSVQTAAYLGSMITGQFTGQVFSKLFYNQNLEESNREFLFTNSIEGGGNINSLNLSRVYVLTTNRRTASASELLINSLKPYIDVVVVGENTVGKTQVSQTVYDSPSLFTTEDINPNHTYAMQPLIANSTNVNDQLVLPNGLQADIEVTETPSTLRTLGMINEPLLGAAIQDIINFGRSSSDYSDTPKLIKTKGLLHPFEQDMYIEK